MNETMTLEELEGFVVIVTYGRSGSTLLQNMLNSIPGYQIRGENNDALSHLAQSWWAIESAQQLRGLRKIGAETDQTHPWYGGEKIDPRQVGYRLASGFVDTILKPDAGVRVAGFKEIRFHWHPQFFPQYMNFIHTFFPRARFIINTRDHDAVAKSGWWSSQDPKAVKVILEKAETLFDSYSSRFPNRFYNVSYDTYVGNPQAFAGLFDFLGEEFDIEVARDVLNNKLGHARS